MDVFLRSLVVQICALVVWSYCLAALTRRVVENCFPAWVRTVEDAWSHAPYKTAWARWWNEVLLYLPPPIWGVIGALLLRRTSYFPPNLKEREISIIFGISVGFMSRFLYKLLVSVLAKKITGQETTDPKASTDAMLLATPTDTASDKDEGERMTGLEDTPVEGKKEEEPVKRPAGVVCPSSFGRLPKQGCSARWQRTPVSY